MTDMPPATPVPAKAAGRGAAWAVLIGMGVTSVTYNVFHAVHGDHLEVVLALLLGVAPAYATALLSHVVAVLDAPWWIKGLVLLVVLGGMVLSASATAAVVAPAEPGWRGWLFGGVLDAAALLALWAILEGGRRRMKAGSVVEAAAAEAAAAVQRATAAEQELASVRESLTAELENARAVHSTQMDELRSELEAQIQSLTSALNKALNKRPASQRKRATSSPRAKAPSSPPATTVPDDVDTQAEALRILGEEPDISGGELGLRLGKSKRYGCILKNKLAPSVAGPDTEGTAS